MSRNTGVSKDELSRLSMRVEEMVSGINSDRLSNTVVSVVASGFFVFLLGSFLMGLVWNSGHSIGLPDFFHGIWMWIVRIHH